MDQNCNPARTIGASVVFHVLLTVLWVLPAAARADSISNRVLDSVNADLTAGRVDDAIASLNSSLTANPADAEAHNLLCRAYYQEERWDDAIRECETAVRLEPANSEYHLWLGRADGQKADAIHSIKAFGLAKKVRDEFERAVQLDGKNVDALSDLGEFYTAAPGIVGGGKKKAQGVVPALEQHSPAQAHQLKGRLAEKDKNFPLAETEFKAAVEASNQSADAWMTLASFYFRRQQWDQMLGAVHAGIDADAKSAKPHGPALVDAAGILSRSHQQPQLAIQLLRLYLDSPNKSADSPAFQVHAQLSHLLEQQGDHAGAQEQIAAAAALARQYHPKAG
jgi:tetratricopeptide (TPR) repeat protein